MKLVGFCHGAPFDPHTWSGTNRGIFTALQQKGLLLDVFDVELAGLQRYWIAAREYSPDITEWKHNFLKSPYAFHARTRNAVRHLSALSAHNPTVLQAGAMFDATVMHPALPRFCYLDSNSALSKKGGRQAFGYYAKTQYKTLSLRRERHIYHRSAGIFTFSRHLKDSLIRDFGVADEKVHVVYAGVNIPLPDRGVDKHGDAPKDPVILFIGRDFERKGGRLLLDAFARVRRRVPRAELIIAGAKPQIDAPGVKVLGFIDKNSRRGEAQLAALYRRAAVFTMPSHFEPFGIVYAEAMHYGVPCVGVRHGAMPEIISDGVTGMITEPDNEVDLADALIAVLTQPHMARSMGAAAMTKANALFRWDVVADKMAGIMQAQIARKAGVARVEEIADPVAGVTHHPA